MQAFWSVFRYEFRMSIHRKGMWIAYGLLFILLGWNTVANSKIETGTAVTNTMMWQSASMIIFMINLFAPVIAGITAADRLIRDHQLGVDELLRSTSLRRGTYLWGKYFGVLASLLVPIFGYTVLTGVYAVVLGTPPVYLGMLIVCFIVMLIPAYMFVLAFSLASPLVIPLRVYQVLFTGYWYWGNYLNPKAFPSISDTLLVPCGKIAMGGLFYPKSEMFFGSSDPTVFEYSYAGVAINFLLLAVCILLAMFAADRFLAHREKTA
jgi:ABC-type transport system involved in multi-copper enzyme maturation permease subunit